ncbi:MAG: M20 family metallopeptidase [Planctomycetota bacterium]|jgi:acetylornithine deacetylase
MSLHKRTVHNAVHRLLPSAEDLLCRLISFPSTSGKEHELMGWAAVEFEKLGVEVRRVPLSDRIKDDEDYSTPIPDIGYDGRFNLRLRLPGRGDGRKLLLNTHTDVVPPSQGQEKPFEAVSADGVVYGRGACDAKGQAAAIWLVLATLLDMGTPLAGDVIAHLVVEEENGGNGTLAMVRNGEEADGCIVMEPTAGKVFTSVRGAVWFRVFCEGKAGHSGRAGETVSALALARKTMDVLEGYHRDLLAASRGIPLFDKYENPMPITFGRLTAGTWPATAPARATLEGVLGLLPNKTRFEVMDEFRAALESGDPQLRDRVRVEFIYRHDSHVLDPNHPLAEGLVACCRDWGLPAQIDAMTASCDSWFYHNQLGIPTVVYGPGSLAYAHGSEEQIALAEIAEAACALVDFAGRWCT